MLRSSVLFVCAHAFVCVCLCVCVFSFGVCVCVFLVDWSAGLTVCCALEAMLGRAVAQLLACFVPWLVGRWLWLGGGKRGRGGLVKVLGFDSWHQLVCPAPGNG